MDSSQTPVRLRPLGVADMLDAAVHLYRHNFVLLVLIAATVVVPLSTLEAAARLAFVLPLTDPQYLAGSSDPSTLMVAAQWLSLLLTFASLAAIYGLMMPALVWAVGQRYMDRPASLRAAYGRVVRRLPLMAVVVCVLLVGELGLAIMAIPPCCFNWIAAPAAGLFASVNLLTLLAPVAMLENGGLLVSLKRCWVLTKSNFWRALGLIVALYLFSTAVTSGPSLLAVLVVGLLAENLALSMAVSSAIGALLNVIYLPIWGISLALLYYDTRVRREALDLELLSGLQPRPELYAQWMKWFDLSDLKTLAILALLTLVPFVLAGSFIAFLAALGAWLEATGT